MGIVGKNSSIGKNIRQLRQKKGWSQGEAAKCLKISIPAFSKIESGITDINISRLNQIANLFEVSIFDIIAKEGISVNPGSATEVRVLKERLADQEDEIIKLQKKVIDLYEEIRSNNPS
ncbi:XRE family transcriptional regulator [Pedobacter frigiditerrae]|uniref:XRE family transcriptional regulator n=1 Tax=Pedobacter frigiditerrae TaxID=2530452 RepID=A0A4R0MSC0_9SPHI|nr:helix-turn-helix transcriptional regulator [Pedobacter frigiditerrae]TCC89102.1 XRE family transcriptional regulator [Pedobacter frigiditerrae]